MPVSRSVWTGIVAMMAIIMTFATIGEARPLNRAGADLIRQTAEVGLRSPRPLDVRRFEGADIVPLRRTISIDEVALLRFLRQSDAGLARAIEAADPTLRRATLEALAGARAIERALPSNPVRRAQIVERGGVDLLRAAARPIDGLGDALLLLDGSIRTNRIPDTTLARFGSALDAHGDAFSRIWRDYIVPNWEVVVGGGLVVALLVDPDSFIDASGRLTRHAVSAVADLGVEISASVVEGVLQGIWRSVSRRIEEGAGWTVMVLGMILVAIPTGWFLYARRSRNRKKPGRKT